MSEKKKKKEKKTNAITRWWRETVGELRKVTWPTPQEAWRLTKVVIIHNDRDERNTRFA